jgi:hypothetical protein
MNAAAAACQQMRMKLTPKPKAQPTLYGLKDKAATGGVIM